MFFKKESKEVKDCKEQTQKHIDVVATNLHEIIHQLFLRSTAHDKSKLESPELEIFVEYTPKLASSTYGSDEYKRFLDEMKVALDHHYSVNCHHPEFFSDGIKGMNLVDVIEMFCDWYAATKRHNNGDIMKSIDINQKRFGYSDDLAQIFRNTVKLLEG